MKSFDLAAISINSSPRIGSINEGKIEALLVTAEELKAGKRSGMVRVCHTSNPFEAASNSPVTL